MLKKIAGYDTPSLSLGAVALENNKVLIGISLAPLQSLSNLLYGMADRMDRGHLIRGKTIKSAKRFE